MKKLSTLIILLFTVLFLLPQQAQAVAMRSSNTVDVEKEEVINETLFSFSQNLTIDGHIKGDVICVGQSIKITGTIDGDVICAGQNLSMEGTVSGDIRFAGQELNIDGAVANNITYLGQEASIEKESVVGGEFMMLGQKANIDGQIKKNIGGDYEKLTISGLVGGKVGVEVDKLVISENASIGGNLDYRSKNKANIAQLATVSGKVNYTYEETNKTDFEGSRTTRGIKKAWTVGQFVQIIIATLLGIAIVTLLPKYSQSTINILKERKAKAFTSGLLLLFLTPIIGIILVFTILGIPLAIILFFIYIIALFVGKIIVGIYVGYEILGRNTKKKKKVSLRNSALIGVAGIWLLGMIPAVGWLVSLTAAIFGLGVLYLQFKGNFKS